MKPADEIRQLFKNAHLGLDPDADEKVFEDVFDAHKETTENTPATPEIWRIIMKGPLTKITAAAVAVVAAVDHPRKMALKRQHHNQKVLPFFIGGFLNHGTC